jgi:hypothetical protein
MLDETPKLLADDLVLGGEALMLFLRYVTEFMRNADVYFNFVR